MNMNKNFVVTATWGPARRTHATMEVSAPNTGVAIRLALANGLAWPDDAYRVHLVAKAV